MSVLQQRYLNPQLPRQKAMLDVGGLWCVSDAAEPGDIISRAKELGVRALEWHKPDISLVAELPQLEFLLLQDVHDPEPLHSLTGLRGLHISGTWDGQIDFRRLTRLESFSVVECPRDEGGLQTLYDGHDSIQDLTIQRYRHRDLTPLERLRLRSLNLGYTRSLSSLAGIESLAPSLRRLGLYACSNLRSLEGIASAAELEALELGTLRHITTLEFAQDLPNLRRLDIFDLAGVESLWPLADHPSLEFLTFGRVRDLDLEPLTRLPQLKLFLTGNYRWNRDRESLPLRSNFPDDHPYVQEWHALEI